MQTKVLIVAIVENDNGDILLRKKPAGSPPYLETWYIFGAELAPGEDIQLTLRQHIIKQAGVSTTIASELSWDVEVKADIDGVVKQFVYLDVLCRYDSGELRLSEGVERLEWVPKTELIEYDNVPPSVKLFHKLGYIKG